MNIKEMNIQELKAMAYDETVKLEIAKQNLAVLNQEISSRNNVEEKDL